MAYNKLQLSAVNWDFVSGLVVGLRDAILATGQFDEIETFLDREHKTWRFTVYHRLAKRCIQWRFSNYSNTLGYTQAVRNLADSADIRVNGEGAYNHWGFPVTANINILHSPDMFLLTDKNGNTTNHLAITHDKAGKWYVYCSYGDLAFPEDNDAVTGNLVFNLINEKTSAEELVCIPARLKNSASLKIEAEFPFIMSSPNQAAMGVYKDVNNNYSWYVSNRLFLTKIGKG